MIILKYIICSAIVVGVMLAPAYLARVNGKAKCDMMIIRMSSWVFGWTVIGWLLALFWSIRK
ncbi:MAG: superinfection immunity protein [Rickettsiales bacterium]|jgi:hypothetical protein|nr:superinfection immunity protein [Rickettsiales bacterium]